MTYHAPTRKLVITWAGRVQRAVSALPAPLRWTPHNLIAHPVSECLSLLGLGAWGRWLHDATIPGDAAAAHDEGGPR